jgi:predicted DNA-binding WGR domain protein
MLAVISLELEARDQAANRLRRWHVDIGHDLSGTWLADVQYGRIGSRGRQVRLVFESRPECAKGCKYLWSVSRMRATASATAKRRIGVDYRYAHASDEVRGMLGTYGIQPPDRSDDTQVKVP